MTTKRIVKSSILEAVHETAQDLLELDFINKNRMQRALRDRYKLSQSAFAIVLNTSPSTIRKWEVGDKHPSGPSLKLLNLLDRKGLEVLI
jgi:putative transcriptional regulator